MFLRWAFLVAAALAVTACSGDTSSVLFDGCTAGQTQACDCEASAGVQVCGPSGSFLACICTPGVTADAGVDPTCVPSESACAGKDCGLLADGCGGFVDCGSCASGESCGTGSDANVCIPELGSCAPSCAGQACGGDDGCGGTCQHGACAPGQQCFEGACTCDSTTCAGCCSGNVCVDGTSDPTACGVGGGQCTVCQTGTTCDTSGECACVPNCANAACGGAYGCGGICASGTCPEGETCFDDTCM